MLDFSRAFSTAWERMVIILFRPFDFGKWFVIGFSAFLAGMMHGGNGYDGSGLDKIIEQWNPPAHHAKSNFSELQARLHDSFAGIPMAAIIVAGIFFLFFVLCFFLLTKWLGARGNFLFIDNIVRNRGEIAIPWTQYARAANGFFLLYVGLALIGFCLIVPFLAAAGAVAYPLLLHPRWPNPGEWLVLSLLAIVNVAVMILVAVVLFLVRDFCPPLMFRQNLATKAAFLELVGLVKRNPGNFALIALLRMVLTFAVVFYSVVVCALTCCCCGLLPYLGTVLILPALIYVRCFTLDCLAQLGPQYDVWTVDVPTASTAPLSPPPQLG